MQGKLDILEDEMEYFRAFTTKLKTIINPSSRTDTDLSALRQGIGLVEDEALSIQSNSNNALRDASLQNADSLFFKSSPLNLERGELVIEEKKDYALLNIRLDKAISESKLQRQDGLRLWESLSQKQSLLEATPAVSPTNGWVTSDLRLPYFSLHK